MKLFCLRGEPTDEHGNYHHWNGEAVIYAESLEDCQKMMDDIIQKRHEILHEENITVVCLPCDAKIPYRNYCVYFFRVCAVLEVEHPPHILLWVIKWKNETKWLHSSIG